MRFRASAGFTYPAFCLVLALAAITLSFPGGMRAQQPTPAKPGGGASPDIGGADSLPPVITITPGTETTGTQTFSVTIQWCDNVSLKSTTRRITFNGTTVTSNFTYVTTSHTGCGAYATSTGSVTLVSGSNSFSAYIMDNALNEGTGAVTYTYTPPVHAVAVTPDNQAVNANAKRSNSYGFTVTNTGNVSETLSLAATCTGTATGCPGSLGPVTLGLGADTTVQVSYQAGTGGDTGTVRLRATDTSYPSATDSGSIHVTAAWESYLVTSAAFNNQDDETAGRCANQCFSGTYAQSTVPYFSMGTARQVTLAYNGDHVAVRPVVYEDVSLGSGAYSVQQYWLEAKHNGASLTFLNGETRLHFKADSTHPTRTVRLAGQLDLSGSATQLYPLVLILTAQYTDHTETVVDSTSLARLLVDNERTSLVARGWTLTGIEHLTVASDGSALITEGDGSALVFRCWSGTTPCTGGYTTPAGEYSTLTVSGSGMLLTYTRLYPDSSYVLFNYLGQMEAVRDRFGNAVNYEYDSYGRLTSITDPIRRSHASGTEAVITLTYNSYGLARIIEPSAALGDSAGGRATIVTVASDSTLRSIQDPDGHSTQFVYDGSRRLAKIISRRGDTTMFAYNATSWKLDSILSPRVPIDAGGGTTTMQSPVVRYMPWQPVGVPTGSTASVPFVPVAPDSVVARVTDPEGHVSTYTVDRWGQPLVATDPLGRVTTITRSGPLAVRVVYPSGAKDSAAYNGQGLVTYSAPAGQNPSRITYGAYALPTQITGSSQPTQTFKYGMHGRDSLVTVAGLTTHYYADLYGRDTAMTDPGGHIYKLHYDGTFGNLDSTLAAGTGQPVQYTRTRFDGYGRDSIQMASGRVGDTTVYDSTNRVVRVAAPGHHVVTMAYDPLFRRTVTDAKGQVYRDSLNALGWRVEHTDPTGAVTKYRYNRDGLLTSTTNRRQQVVTQSYDPLHRLLAKSGTGVVADSFAYNATGTVQVGWSVVSRDSAFTNAVTGWTDSVVTRFATGAGSERFRRYYRPTALQQLDSLGLTSPSTITLTGRRYFWSATTGQLDSIKVGSSRFRMHYNAEGLPDTLTYPGGAKRATLYSSVHLPTRQAFTLTALDTVLSHSYRYDSLGQMLEDDHKIHAGANESMHVFSYDATGQLAALQLMELNNDTTCVTNGDFGIECADTTYAITDAANTFQYDSVGNLRTDFDSSSMSATTGTYTTGDRQSAWGATSYTYDADGNRLTRTTGGHTVTYHWTADGMLDSVKAGSVTLTYAYNAFGQLVRRSRNGHPERYFLWDNGQLLAELDSSATHRVGEYAYAPGTDAPIALVTGSGTVQQVVQDVNGNVIGLFTGSSSITERETYAPWGALETGAVTSLADTNRLRWKGLVWEGDSTQLYYVRARWYDPVSRRFVSEDPLGVDAGVNPYVYGGSNPVNHRDPSGMYYTDGLSGCYYGWLSCQSIGGGGSGFPLSRGGNAWSGPDEAYKCDVQSVGAQACLDQANAYLSGSFPLGPGWSDSPFLVSDLELLAALPSHQEYQQLSSAFVLVKGAVKCPPTFWLEDFKLGVVNTWFFELTTKKFSVKWLSQKGTYKTEYSSVLTEGRLIPGTGYVNCGSGYGYAISQPFTPVYVP